MRVYDLHCKAEASFLEGQDYLLDRRQTTLAFRFCQYDIATETKTGKSIILLNKQIYPEITCNN